MYVAALSGGEFVGFIVALGGLLGGFYAFANKQLKEARKERVAHTKILASGMDKLAKSNLAIRDEMRDGNRAAEQRNGHLGEQSEKIAKLIVESRDTIIKSTQHVDKQEVEQQTVREVK